MKKEKAEKKDLKVLDKITFKSFLDYLENHILLIILTILILFVTHGYLMFNNNIGII